MTEKKRQTLNEVIKFVVTVLITRTPAQKEAMKLLILRLHREFPDIKTILGHRDLPGMQKACPCFDATKLQPLLAS